MQQQPSKKENFFVKFLKNCVEKMDKKMEEKCQTKSCCQNEKSEGDSCCK